MVQYKHTYKYMEGFLLDILDHCLKKNWVFGVWNLENYKELITINLNKEYICWNNYPDGNINSKFNV